jgi:hypothetical protein
MGSLPAYADQFGSNGKGDLGGGFAPDGGPDRGENFLQTALGDALFFQHIEHKAYPAATPDKADIGRVFF